MPAAMRRSGRTTLPQPRLSLSTIGSWKLASVDGVARAIARTSASYSWLSSDAQPLHRFEARGIQTESVPQLSDTSASIPESVSHFAPSSRVVRVSTDNDARSAVVRVGSIFVARVAGIAVPVEMGWELRRPAPMVFDALPVPPDTIGVVGAVGSSSC